MTTTLGKWRHLSRASTPNGHFVIMAIDHRSNLLAQLNQHAAIPLTDEAFAAFKQAAIGALAPYSSAVLTDPAYGMAGSIIHAAVSGRTGLLAPVEVTDYGVHPSEREIAFIPHWSVKKIKLVGGDGVKLLLPYHPEAANVAEKHAVVRQLVEECAAFDLPFYLEPIPYALDPRQSLRNDDLLHITVTMCETFSAMGVDVLKLSFPVDPKQSSDPGEWRQACEAVTAACRVPWALLSGGVSYETFLRQSEIACQAGASGVIVGRAVWAEAVELQAEARMEFLAGEAVARMQALAAVCAASARPWQSWVEKPQSSLTWYENYPL